MTLLDEFKNGFAENISFLVLHVSFTSTGFKLLRYGGV
jgi:hypothetical protein